jgi:hypothetical protein
VLCASNWKGEQVGKKGAECDWRRLVVERRWDEINWLQLPFHEQKDFLKALRAVLPKKSVENGMEISQRFVTPAEATVELRGAAVLLALGELEAAVEGDPLPAADRWEAMRDDVAGVLGELAAVPELTEGDQELSRQRHAREALSYLQRIDFSYAVAKRQIPGEDQEWLYAWLLRSQKLCFLQAGTLRLRSARRWSAARFAERR